MKVSVICTEEAVIRSSVLYSLLRQTMTDFEIILPEAYYLRDSRIKHEVSPTGEYVFCIDMTVGFAPNMLAVMTAGMDKENADIGICGRTMNKIKTAAITTVSRTDDKKFALVQRLIKKGLLFTPNNTIIRNDHRNNFIDSCVGYIKDSTIYNFSNAFIISDVASPPKEPIIDVLQYFLSRGSV